jgi:hypothetical protein
MSDRRTRLVLPLLALPRSEDDLLVRLTITRGVAAWAPRIREAEEACLLLDENGRLVALSTGCALALTIDPVSGVGQPLVDLVEMVDFSATGLRVEDPEVQLPPLKALRTDSLARGLVRLRLGKTVTVTYDVVGVPLAGGVGALAFFSEV